MTALQLASFRRQQLLIEYASLKHIKLRGVYVSLTPNDPAQWVGVLFVRSGVYAPAVFRFRIHFPSEYPYVPPVITFNSDIFHPLLTPLTTYTYTGPPQGDGTEAQQLPPVALSLRHGFPAWYKGRATADKASPRSSSPAGPGIEDTNEASGGPEDIAVAEILRYVRTCFEDAAVLDSIPLEAAANPSAWYAWQSHRGRSGNNGQASDGSTPPRGRGPQDWNWDAVWDERVTRAVQGSLAEASLYGNAGAREEAIKFVNLGAEELSEGRRLLQTYERPLSR